MREFVQSKLKKFGIWYLKFCLLWSIFTICLNEFQWNKSTLFNTLLVTSKSFYSIYWFIPTLIISELIALFVIKKGKNQKVIFILGIIAYIISVGFKNLIGCPLPFCAYVGMLGSFFIICGWLFREYAIFNNLDKKDSIKKMLVCLLIFTGLFLICYGVLKYSPAYFLSIDIGNPVLFACTGVIGSITVLYFSVAFERKFRILNSLGKNSLNLYGIHYFFLPLIEIFNVNNIIEGMGYVLIPSILVVKCIEKLKFRIITKVS